MSRLFFYGSLRHVPLLEIVLGRSAAELELTTTHLPDHQVCAVAEGPFPTLISKSGGRAVGLVVAGLSAEDIARLDYYEGGFDYDLVDLPLEEGGTAQVYMSPAGRWTATEPWSLEVWERNWGAMSCHAAREVMGYRGTRSREEVAEIFGPIRTRAWARVLAADARHGAGTLHGKVTLTDHARVYSDFFALDEMNLQFERFDGTMSPALKRSVFVPVDAALVLPYDPVRDRVMMVEQVRVGPIVRGDVACWQLEPIAGRIDPGETPQEAARREAEEEAGVALGKLESVAECYASPGNSTEFFHIFVGIADLPDDVAGVGGLASEDEDIRSHIMSFDAFMTLCDTLQVANSPLVLAGYWLAQHRERLRSEGSTATS
ncbi:tellurium resistance protein [Sulfitobacter sp. SK012]|uniref:NUDIX domain-containing protein n=1 Tax=Sulfitobacter sp. SK012 TaxID=1389005 RepID=UPI000E0A264A|nr:NUDIX domain-containing protein [Sulfitobacter sp. SK012]AXI48859.1 tellurium resistance protein [Sulfitobacter sp. SK012]